ncbi:MAG: N-methyl-L-tryptophan oxidase [Anaerolineae bacterium]|nr:N-methyl-L-tryptophan oxidase [Anaerolineales bacterium]MCQ3974525.1 N-methyl-L-tryptophan oxidase [Anaerolineae bacterium]
MTRRYNAIVLGVGAMGSATCYELAKRGRRVLGLEQYDVPHNLGSSHGHTRIIRLAYYEHPSYVMLLRRAYELWREIQARVGEQLLRITGSIDAGPADSWVFKGSWQSCLEHDLPHEVLTGRELNERFPGYQLSPETMAVLQPDGGFLAPERCIVAYVNAATALGAEIHGREKVLEWQPLSDGGVRVTTSRDVYEADRLVITAGAWDAHILDFLQGLAVPERQVLAWLQPLRPELFTLTNFPVFNLLVPEGRYYGFPVFGIPGFKFGKYHHFEEQGMPDQLDRDPHDYDEAMLREFADRYFPQGSGPTMSLASCMFTNSPDKHFIIDLHPSFPQVSFASACSGHGFKFVSVVGEILADLAERGETRHNIEFFRLDRFTGHDRRPETGDRHSMPPRSPVPGPRSLSGGHFDDRISTLAETGKGAIRPFW